MNNLPSVKRIIYEVLPSKEIMQLVAIFALIGGALLANQKAQAAGFDCAKASTVIEKRICADETLSKLDEALNARYKAKLEVFPDPSLFKLLQKEWLSSVRNYAADNATLVRFYQNRIAILEKCCEIHTENDLSWVETPLPIDNGGTFPRPFSYSDAETLTRINEVIDAIIVGSRCGESPDGFETVAKVTYSKHSILSIHSLSSWYCGGPYPVSKANQSLTFDLLTGQAVRFDDLFIDFESAREEIVEKSLKDLILVGECRDVRSDKDLAKSTFNFHIDDDQVYVQPDFPHAISACSKEVILPLEALTAFIPDDGIIARLLNNRSNNLHVDSPALLHSDVQTSNTPSTVGSSYWENIVASGRNSILNESIVEQLYLLLKAQSGASIVTNYLWNLYIPRANDIPSQFVYNPNHIDYILQNGNRSHIDAAKTLFNVSRQPSDLLELYATYHPLLRKLISQEAYTRFYKPYVDNLLLSHNHMVSQENYLAVMKKISTSIPSAVALKQSQATDPYPSQLNVFTEAMFENLYYKPDYRFVDGEALWLHTFWYRRYHEGNVDAVIQILTDVQKQFAK